ncbi:hypothetical protein M422DRAFT_275471 [Sphaerobolus stellatus SS14]|uniref:Uncharacterized protein n=1 Tax=Sphaerobolus stellatus (strain SS14) TaxID=990650 RepID=A0A0C9UEI6_SPHS4|nr:hypothetical protein M422DRAFT_275471 [Sphaerobolus stellatus SS14]
MGLHRLYSRAAGYRLPAVSFTYILATPLVFCRSSRLSSYAQSSRDRLSLPQGPEPTASGLRLRILSGDQGY